jgi:hypothetical protein
MTDDDCRMTTNHGPRTTDPGVAGQQPTTNHPQPTQLPGEAFQATTNGAKRPTDSGQTTCALTTKILRFLPCNLRATGDKLNYPSSFPFLFLRSALSPMRFALHASQPPRLQAKKRAPVSELPLCVCYKPIRNGPLTTPSGVPSLYAMRFAQ